MPVTIAHDETWGGRDNVQTNYRWERLRGAQHPIPTLSAVAAARTWVFLVSSFFFACASCAYTDTLPDSTICTAAAPLRTSLILAWLLSAESPKQMGVQHPILLVCVYSGGVRRTCVSNSVFSSSIFLSFLFAYTRRQ